MAKKDTLQLAATGRRKTSVARVRMTDGSGTITVNGKEANAYFDTAMLQELLKKTVRKPQVWLESMMWLLPLRAAENPGSVVQWFTLFPVHWPLPMKS